MRYINRLFTYLLAR